MDANFVYTSSHSVKAKYDKQNELHGILDCQIYLDVCSQAGDQIPHGRGWPVEVGHVLRRSTQRAAGAAPSTG